MLNIARIKNGLVIDHIKAGRGIKIFNWLGLDKTSAPVAFISNATSQHMGKKDIIKIDETISIDFTALGLIDHNITVNVIKNEEIVDKIRLSLPKKVENILICKNPRCITSTEKAAVNIFHLVDEKNGTYRCEYCDELKKIGDIY